MKKFLLTLIVTMLTCIGAWAQETILIDGGNDGVSDNYTSFAISATDASSKSISAGDLLRVYWKSTTTDGDAVVQLFVDNPHTSWKRYQIWMNSIQQDWEVLEYELSADDVAKIKSNGIQANWCQNVSLRKLTIVHYAAATGISLNKENITLGIGNTDNTLKATVEPNEANQTVEWSVVSGGESFVSVDANGVITGLAAGQAYVRATVPGTEFYKDCFVKVQKGFSLSLAADKTTVLNTVGGTVNITPTVSLEGESPVEGEDYVIDYTIPDNADPTNVTIDGKVITIKPGAAAGTYTVVAELDPVTAEFAGATATMDFVVDAPLTDAMHFEIDDQTFGKSQGTKEIELILKIDNGTFASLNASDHNFGASSDDESVVTANWKAGTANEYNNTIVFTINGVGEAHVTLTDQATKDGKVAIATKTITVTVTGDPLHFTMDNLTVNYDQPLTLDAIKAAITKVYTEVNSTQTDVDPANYEVEVYKNDAKVETSIPAQNDDYEITVKVIAKTADYTDAEQTVPVTVTHKKSFVVNPLLGKTTLKANGHETTTITPTSMDDETPVAVTYSYESSDPTVATVSPEGVITAQKAGTVTINVTAIPDDKENYATMYATSNVITVTQSYVTITEETIDGKNFVVVTLEEAGAFGDLSDNPDVSSSSIENAVEKLKVAANVKVVGPVSNSDVQELTYLIGDGPSVTEGVCKTLDMGKAKLTETITFEQNGNDAYCSFINHSTAESAAHILRYVEDLTIPQPADDDNDPSNGVETVLPEGMYTWVGTSHSDEKLDKLTIPEGWTKADKSCWSIDGVRTALVILSKISLPNSMTYISDNAFSGLKTPVLVIPPHVTYIGDYAFASTDPAALADVYFTGTTAPSFVSQFAFSSAAQMGNNTIQPANVREDGKTDRNCLMLSNKQVAIMHYPAGCAEQYTDVTRIYSANGRNTNSPTGTMWQPEVWTPEEIAAFKKAVTDYTEHVAPYYDDEYEGYLTNSNVQFNIAKHWVDDETGETDGWVEAAYPDLTVADRVWPSQNIMTNAYSLAWLGFKWDGTDMRNNTEWMNKRGLYQFVTVMEDAPTNSTTWTFEGYENDKWYTICVPFDMSVKQVQDVFGSNVQVCRFSKVTRDIVSEQKSIVLEFRNSVITASAKDSEGNPSTGNKDTYHASKKEDEPSYAGFTGIVHCVPYMIKPNGTASVSTSGEGRQLKRVFEGYEMKGEALVHEYVTATDGSVYDFIGIFRESPLTAGTYFLGRKTDSDLHKFYYYGGGAKMRTPNTAAVFAADGGVEDGSIFFPTENTAPIFMSLFGDDEDLATAIEKVQIVCGDDKVEDNKVYTIGGQLVNANNLPAGLYIKNGKKFIVK